MASSTCELSATSKVGTVKVAWPKLTSASESVGTELISSQNEAILYAGVTKPLGMRVGREVEATVILSEMKVYCFSVPSPAVNRSQALFNISVAPGAHVEKQTHTHTDLCASEG